MRLMNSPDACLGPVNLGNAAEFTILELAEMILDLTGSKSKLVRRPLPVDDPVRRRPDLTCAERELRWRPRIPLRDGLLRTIEYFDGRLTTRGDRRQRTGAPDPRPASSCALIADSLGK
jgi:UDP-glucuronate decarboxylase